MASLRLPHFGILDTVALDDYYDTEFEYNKTEVQLQLNFDNKSIDIQRLETVKHFIDNIRIHDLNNRKRLEKDYEDKDGATVKIYIENELDQLAEDDLAALLGPTTKASDIPRLLLQKLHLVRVGLYPDNEDQFATFDYSLNPEVTNQLVVLFTDANGNLDYMTIES